MLEEELYEPDWKCLKKNYELDWKFRKKTPGCRDERRESERREGKWARLQMNGLGGALFIGRPYTPAVTSADVCMTVHFSAYQRCDENDGAFQRFQPLKWTAGVKVKTVKKLFNFFLFENNEVTRALQRLEPRMCPVLFGKKKECWPSFSVQRSTKQPLKRVPISAVCAQPLKCKRPLYPFFL